MEIQQDFQGEKFVLLDDAGKKQGELRYRVGVNRINAIRVFVEPGFRGHGYATALLEALVRFARELNYRIIPVCPFVKYAFDAHPERYHDVMKQPMDT